LAYGIVVFVAGMIAAWGADLLFPPTTTERALVDQLGLSDGYASLTTMAGIVLLSVMAAVLGCVIAYARWARGVIRSVQ
jgi:hypothetical protein